MTNDPLFPPIPSASATAANGGAFVDGTWHPLPPRGAWLFALNHALGLTVLPLVGVTVFVIAFRLPWWLILLAAALAAVAGAWLGWRRHRWIYWMLDAQGFAIRRGNWWRQETRIPISRVQHLDIRRGPLERYLLLATLLVHTAGTRQASVSLPLLDDGDAEHLRERLSRQLDQDDDAL